MKSIQITEPGMSEYFQNCKGTEFLQAIQALSKCVIWVSSSNTSSRSPSTSQASNIQNMMVSLVISSKKKKNVFIYICINRS